MDNIIISHEILHKFRGAKGKKAFMAWKVDLAKAYDQLQWDFIMSNTAGNRFMW